jgi:hypothetical protein
MSRMKELIKQLEITEETYFYDNFSSTENYRESGKSKNFSKSMIVHCAEGSPRNMFCYESQKSMVNNCPDDSPRYKSQRLMADDLLQNTFYEPSNEMDDNIWVINDIIEKNNKSGKKKMTIMGECNHATEEFYLYKNEFKCLDCGNVRNIKNKK